MNKYYENAEKLKELRTLSAPTTTDIETVLGIIKNDVELTLYFYDVLDPGWVELLDRAGEFEKLREKETGMIGKYKAHYLKQCAKTKAEAVLGIIGKLKAQDINIQGTLVGAIVGMPEETAVKGVELVTKYLDKRESKLWYGIGMVAAELMVKLVANHPDKAFEIADTLFDAWVSEEKTYGKDIVAKFSEYEYGELMQEHYNKVWKVNPERAIEVLVKILKRCLEDLDKEGKGEEGYDASRFFGYGLELGDLNEIDMKHPRIKTILVKGICEAGKVLIEKKPEAEINKLFNQLEETKRVIFLRIAMYLLRFVKPSTEKERISKFISDEKHFVNGSPYWYEHRRLLNDKFDDVSDEAKKIFLGWVDEDKYSEDHRKRIIERCKNNSEKEPDFEKWENYAKAEELSLVRERFKDEYERYKKSAGVKNDSELAPRKRVSEARFVSPEEGSSYSSEKMGKDTVENVINYLLEPKNYEGKENVSGWGTAKDALGASFGADVKKRSMEYLSIYLKKLESLDPKFLDRLFSSISGAVRDGSFKKEGWERLIDLACGIVETKSKEKEWKDCFLSILWVLHDGFGEESNRITFNETIIRKLWLILKELVRYNYDEKSEPEDPFERQLRSVQGGAFSQVILVAIECKNNFKQVFDDFLGKELELILTIVAKEIKRSEVNCTFGYHFASIYWLDKVWIESNTEIIFVDEMWDAVWGTYVSWGSPSPQGFKFLVEKGIYDRAVQKIEENNKYKFRKRPEEGLVEHLMIGYFNGWVDLESDVLEQFFKNASAELRGKAAEFLTTGFKSVNEKGGTEKEKVAARMRKYWKNRLEAIEGNPKENEKETIEFMGWAEDSVLPAKETLELLEQTLELSGGNIVEIRDAWEFVKGVCTLGKGNELLALQCLKKVAEEKNMHYPWAQIQEPLVKFLEELPVGVWNEGREVADLYGRYNPDKFRGVWEKLNN